MGVAGVLPAREQQMVEGAFTFSGQSEKPTRHHQHEGVGRIERHGSTGMFEPSGDGHGRVVRPQPVRLQDLEIAEPGMGQGKVGRLLDRSLEPPSGSLEILRREVVGVP